EAFQYIFFVFGCPYNCLFCGSRNIWSRKVRFRSPENVIEEIKGLQGKGLSSIHFDDDTFGVKRKYIEALCDGMKKHCPGLKWSCEINVKLVDEETVSMMRAAGCEKIEIGIESGNNEILRQIRKNITIEEAFTASELIKKHGIYTQTFFILGFPHDTEETMNDTIKAMKKIKSDFIACGIFTPYPGTEAFEFCKQHGLVDNGYDVSLYNHQSVDACFCLNIPRERFKVLVSRTFKWVDRRNYVNRLKRLVSADSFHKIKEVGISKSIDKGVRIIFGR
ncbi:MAG: radical SAM protein, partial [Deltaproteobacteria bacterium]|nr:radical SAM protein [Deltaproteobacteria bacterium]